MIDRGEQTVERVRRMIGHGDELTAKEIADALDGDERMALTLGFRAGLMSYASHSQERVILNLAANGLAYYWEQEGGGHFKSSDRRGERPIWWLPLSDKGIEIATIVQAQVRARRAQRQRP